MLPGTVARASGCAMRHQKFFGAFALSAATPVHGYPGRAGSLGRCILPAEACATTTARTATSRHSAIVGPFVVAVMRHLVRYLIELVAKQSPYDHIKHRN